MAELNGGLAATFRNVQIFNSGGTEITDSVFGIQGGRLQIPVIVTRRGVNLESEVYLDFEAKTEAADFAPPSFCPPAP